MSERITCSMRPKHGSECSESGEDLGRSWAGSEGYIRAHTVQYSVISSITEALAHDKNFKTFATNSNPFHTYLFLNRNEVQIKHGLLASYLTPPLSLFCLVMRLRTLNPTEPGLTSKICGLFHVPAC